MRGQVRQLPRPHYAHRHAGTIVLGTLLFHASGFCGEAPPAERSPRIDRKVIHATRIPQGPKVDGVLDDLVWSLAEPSGPLTQYQPREGAEASERTEFRVLYDDECFYVGVWCFDREPERIIAREMARDGGLYDDDYIVIALDTFLDRRNGYYFVINPNGAREDSLISNNSYPNREWDGIWTVRTSIDEQGWKVEVAIPFKTLSFDPALDTWGMNVMRRLKRTEEGDRWNAPDADVTTFYVSEAGLVTGLQGLDQGIGLDVVPYSIGRWHYTRDAHDHDLTFDAGADVRYRITPSLQASLSLNTDFAETEADFRQVNLTRFPLFYPEKRDFFLEDAGIFKFGGLGSELIPFFSRRIGLSEEGAQVPIIAASKLTGRVDSYNVGIIDAYVDRHDGLSEKNTFVTRVSKNVLEQSSVGMLTTVGNPDSDDENVMGGLDFNYRTSEFLGSNILEWNNFVLGSYTERADNDENMAFGTELTIPNDAYVVRGQFYQVDEHYDAGLGFVPRNGIRAYETYGSYRPRPESDVVRQLFFSYANSHVTDLSNELDTASHSLTPVYVRFTSGDAVFGSVNWQLDSPDEDFEIVEGVTIPAGEYWWNYYRVGFETADKRPWELQCSYRVGEFYDGSRQGWSPRLTVKASKHFFFSVGYDLNQVRLPQGDFDTHLTHVSTQINFTPALTWYNLVQYDNVAESVGFNSRLVWEFLPGANCYVVLNENIDRDREDYTLRESMLTVKLNVTLRF